MFETSLMLTLTDYAMKRTGKLHEHDPKMWDNLQAEFVSNLDKVNTDLRTMGLAELWAETLSLVNKVEFCLPTYISMMTNRVFYRYSCSSYILIDYWIHDLYISVKEYYIKYKT